MRNDDRVMGLLKSQKSEKVRAARARIEILEDQISDLIQMIERREIFIFDNCPRDFDFDRSDDEIDDHLNEILLEDEEYRDLQEKLEKKSSNIEEIRKVLRFLEI